MATIQSQPSHEREKNYDSLFAEEETEAETMLLQAFSDQGI